MENESKYFFGDICHFINGFVDDTYLSAVYNSIPRTSLLEFSKKSVWNQLFQVFYARNWWNEWICEWWSCSYWTILLYNFFNKLKEGDELYFDITHAYRFMPMLMVLTNYSKFAKTCKVKWISYGKTEDPFIDGTIVELNKLSILQDWTTGAADFVDNGNVDKLIKLSNDELSSKLLMSEESGSTSNSKSEHTNEDKIQTLKRWYLNRPSNQIFLRITCNKNGNTKTLEVLFFYFKTDYIIDKKLW